MVLPSDAAQSQGDVMRRLADLERAVREYGAGRSLEAATIGAGGLSIVDGGAIRVYDSEGGIVEIAPGRVGILDALGVEVLRLGRFADGRYGLRAPNAGGGSIELAQDAVRIRDNDDNVIVELGLMTDGRYGWRVNNATGAPQVRAGQIASGGYGLEAINADGDLVDLAAVTFGQRADYDTNSCERASTDYGDPTTGDVGPAVEVLIGQSGRCKVTIGCALDYTIYYDDDTYGGIGASFAASGANTFAGNHEWSMSDFLSHLDMPAGGHFHRVCRYSYTHYLDNLSPGLTTFEMQYRAIDATLVHGFSDRLIMVEPW